MDKATGRCNDFCGKDASRNGKKVARLKPADVESRFPRFVAGYAEPPMPRRQDAGATRMP